MFITVNIRKNGAHNESALNFYVICAGKIDRNGGLFVYGIDCI